MRLPGGAEPKGMSCVLPVEFPKPMERYMLNKPFITMSTCLILAAMTVSAPAQGLNSQDSIDRIVGVPVETTTERAQDDMAHILSVMDETEKVLPEVRKRTRLDQLDIVYLQDVGMTSMPEPIQEKQEERKNQIVALQQNLEGNAMFFHAIDSRGILLRDVLAVEFADNDRVLIYVAGNNPGE